MNYHVIGNALRTKFEKGVQVTQDDLAQMSQVASRTGRMQDRVLYSAMKRKYEADNQPEIEPEEVEKVTAEQLETAKAEAKRNSTAENIARYTVLKRQYDSQQPAE